MYREILWSLSGQNGIGSTLGAWGLTIIREGHPGGCVRGGIPVGFWAEVRGVARGVAVELRPTLALAVPVVLAELGWQAMGVVDTMIVGRLGAEAVGAVGLGSIIFFAVSVFGFGLLLGLDTVVSQAFGAGDLAGCHRALAQGLYLSLGLTPLLMGLVLLTTPWLERLGVNPAVLVLTAPYLRVIAWSTLPLLIYAAMRRYLQAMGQVRPVMFALISANIVNAVGCWALVYGRLGLPAFGVVGSGWATTLARVYMALVLVGYTLWHAWHESTGLFRISWWFDPKLARRLLGLGLPAATHGTLEVGVFAMATALAGRLDAASLAAHQIVLNISSVTFMIPLGLASAGAVRVGQALGRRDPEEATRAGWTTLTLGAAFMGAAGLTLCVAPRPILWAFTDDPRVLATGVSLLFVAAGFQLFDGLQGVTTGNLRGAGDTQTPMACMLVAHWVLGLPVGYALGFSAGYGVVGLWLGLCLGLVAAGGVLVSAWVRKTQALLRG